MTRYGLLILPATNRVYARAAVDLTRAELEIFGRSALDGRIGELDTEVVGGASYITFTGDGLTERDLAVLGNLSAGYALFEIVGELLRPIEWSRLDRYDDDLLTIQKYPGKTNEQFTKLLLNVTLLASDWAGEMTSRRFRVLDPLCGRGTTLNQALMYGFDAAGIERDQKDVEAYRAFITTWLKQKRVKHRVLESGPVRRERKVVGRRVRIELAPTREEHKAGQTQLLDVVNADTTRSAEFFRPETVDLVVADAPYGVQHGSRTAGQGSDAATRWRCSRTPRRSGPGCCAPAVRSGISWNTHVASRDDAAAALADAGLTVVDAEPYRALRHRVDQSIMRDVLVARRPA